MFYEIRRYQTKPGRRDEWVEYMEGVVLPYQTSLGMDVLASFVDEEDPDGYVWIRRFADEDDREKLYRAVYENARWQDEIGPVVYELLEMDKISVTRAVPTSSSWPL
ncbi:NIPSNAP family protein [Lentzea sp. JNUCC 0626]|uniref:NIPSNAP family protein n=1 Tax=Lentzea sp. JNUCC 0626 TaxID=3367513 RepID=UPI003747E22B